MADSEGRQPPSPDFVLFGDAVRMQPLTWYRLPRASSWPSWSLHVEWPTPAAMPDPPETLAATAGAATGFEAGCDDLYLVRDGNSEVLRWPGVADFELTAQDIDVRVCAQPDASLHGWLHGRIETCLLGPVLAYRLERHGLPALHASAVVLPGRDGAVGFLAGNRAGKSTLSVSLVAAARGAALLTDDILALEQGGTAWYGRPGYPQVRLWPDAVEALLHLDPETLPPVHPEISKRRVEIAFRDRLDAEAGGAGTAQPWSPGVGRFCTATSPLRSLYLPRRLDDPGASIDIEPLSAPEALFELLRCSFLAPDLLAAVGLQAERLDGLSRLVREVPVKRLTYPSGYSQLPRVHEALLADHP